MGVRGLRQAEHAAQMDLSGRRQQQVVASDDLFDTLVRVVDDHCEVVGRNAVVATEDDIVDDRFAPDRRSDP